MSASVSSESVSKPMVRKLRLLPLLAATYFMVSGGPYDLEDIIGFGGYGHALLLLGLLPFLWSFPTALMLGELAAAVPEEGGFYAWVRRAMGPFWGFQEAWLSLAASVFDMAIYPTTFVLYLARIAPSLTSGHRGIALELGVVGFSVLWNLRGATAVGEGSLKLWILSISPYLVLIVIAVYIGLRGATGPFGGHSSMAPPVHPDYTTALLVAMWNYMGWDNVSTVAGEVDRPQRTYPLAMAAALAIVTVSYVLPIGAVALTGLPASQWSTGGWADVARAVTGIGSLAVAITIGGMIGAVDTLNSLTMALSRLPAVLADDGYLPKLLARRTRTGAPWVSIVACAVCWAVCLNLTFVKLIMLDVLLTGLSIILQFAALVGLRLRQPNLPRPYRVPGGLFGAIAIGIPPAALLILAVFRNEAEPVGPINALEFGAILIAAGFAAYYASRRNPNRKTT
jgi:amino acid transporter